MGELRPPGSDGTVAARVRALRAAKRALEALGPEGRALGQLVTRARNELAQACRVLARKVLATRRIPAEEIEDLASEATMRVLGKLEAGSVKEGAEDAYVARAAKNAAADWHRAQSGVRRREELFDEALVPDDRTDDVFVGDDDEEARERAREKAAREALRDAPAAYRQIIVAVYFDMVPIESLVALELEKERAAAGAAAPYAPDARRRARARVDKRLQRARDWLRRGILARLDGGGRGE